MSDPLVKKVTADDGVERYVAARGPSDTDPSGTEPAATAGRVSDTPEPADPNDPEADQPAKLVTEGAPDAAAADAADGDGTDTGSGKRRP